MASFLAKAAHSTAEETCLLEGLEDTSSSPFRMASTYFALWNNALGQMQWGCRIVDCSHQDPETSVESGHSSAEPAAEVLNRPAEYSASSAEGLLSRLDPPMAIDFKLLVGWKGRTGSLQEELVVGVMFVGPVGSPMRPLVFRLFLLVAAALRQKYRRCELRH